LNVKIVIFSKKIFKFHNIGVLKSRPLSTWRILPQSYIHIWSYKSNFGGWNLPSLMVHGDFIFFQILFFLNLEYTWTFISTIGILVWWKNELIKNSRRIASVMEIFCTLLQCRVDLSMFHSSSTSKIWHTST
jgi:hypothetical protein